MNVFERSEDRIRSQKERAAIDAQDNQCRAWGHTYRNVYCSNPRCPSRTKYILRGSKIAWLWNGKLNFGTVVLIEGNLASVDTGEPNVYKCAELTQHKMPNWDGTVTTLNYLKCWAE